ncbi:MAG: hypothetical protein COA78_19225 [Blastopirellula sp.]|nr:MAG: hypothetical protein COA78_19225 [Blastopirellula sp.]
MSGNQYDETREKLQLEIQFAREQLIEGRPMSEVANELHGRGMGMLFFIFIFREATGVGIGDLKCFGPWWSDDSGVTNVQDFDAYANELNMQKHAIDWSDDDHNQIYIIGY